MYRDRLLNFGGFLFSLKGGIWLLGFLAWSIGLFDRTFCAFLDGHLITGEIFQLTLICAALIGWFYLKPSSRLNDKFLTGINNMQNLESRDESKLIAKDEHLSISSEMD